MSILTNSRRWNNINTQLTIGLFARDRRCLRDTCRAERSNLSDIKAGVLADALRLDSFVAIIIVTGFGLLTSIARGWVNITRVGKCDDRPADDVACTRDVAGSELLAQNSWEEPGE